MAFESDQPSDKNPWLYPQLRTEGRFLWVELDVGASRLSLSMLASVSSHTVPYLPQGDELSRFLGSLILQRLNRIGETL